jgi:hypothetical protein
LGDDFFFGFGVLKFNKDQTYPWEVGGETSGNAMLM